MHWSYRNNCGMFGTMAPDNGVFTGDVIKLVGSTHLIEIVYHVPVGNQYDTINWITGGGYNNKLGWDQIGSNRTWWVYFYGK